MADINYVTPGGVRVMPALRRMSWGAIFSGAFCGLAIALTLDALGVGVLGLISQPGAGMTHGLTLASAIWLIVASLVSFFIGGWVSGRLAAVPNRGTGALHGLTVWGLAVVAVAVMLGGIAAGTVQMAASASNAAAASMAQHLGNGVVQRAQMGMVVPGIGAFGLAGFAVFIGLALSCVFATLGGAAGTPRPVVAPVAAARPVVEEPVIRREEPPRRVA